jgi:hypothetical protein
MYDKKDSPEEVAERFELPLQWAQMHTARHRCVDNKWYTYNCLITDPTCEDMARNYMRLAAQS